MRKLMAGLVALVALAGCDVLTAPFGGGGPDPYPIHIVWGTLDAEGRPSLGGRLESHAASVEAAAARWAKVIAPTPVERGSYVLEKDWEWWRAGDRIAHGITIVAMEHQCNGNPGCAGTLLVTHPDNPHVMWGGIGLHPSWGSSESTAAHEIGHNLIGSIESMKEGYIRYAVAPRVVKVWRDGKHDGYPAIIGDGIHLSDCTTVDENGLSGVMTVYAQEGERDGRYRITEIEAAMVGYGLLYDPDAVVTRQAIVGAVSG